MNNPTVADAAQELGVTERRLRRLLSLPEYAARTETITRQTRTGTRQAVTIPAPLLEEIRHRLEADSGHRQDAANANAAAAGTDAAQSSQHGGTGLTRTESLLAQVVADKERQIVRQEEEIRFLREQVQELTRRVPVSVPVETVAEPRRWWQWWKR